MTIPLDPETLEELKGTNEIMRRTLGIINQTRTSYDFCIGPTMLESPIQSNEMWEGFVNLKKRGVKIRIIVKITNQNLGQIRDLIQLAEVRHLEGLSDTFAISDCIYYTAPLQVTNDKPAKMMVSNATGFVKQQQHFFEILWKSAIPAETRVEQLEGGKEPEVTEIVTGWTGIIQRTIDGFTKAVRGVDHCCDSMIPPRMVGSPVEEAISHFVRRGGKVRLITEITKENLASIRELMKFQEIRHIARLMLNFGVSDNMFSAPTSVYSLSAEPQCIWSNSQSLIREHQYLFETLWEKALPADIRLRELEEGVEPEITEVLTGWDNIFKRNIADLSQSWEKVDSCCDAQVPSMIVESPMYRAILDLEARGCKIRMITEITRENLASVKVLMKGQEIRHISNFKINFGVSDYSFTAPTSVYSSSSNPQCIYSNSKELIREHQYLFETLWDKAVPAEQRIQQIEQGVEPEKVELIQDTRRSISLAFEIMKRTRNELLILFATPRTFTLGSSLGSVKAYDEMSKRGVSVRLLVPEGREIEKELSEIRKLHPTINVKLSSVDLITNITILVSDRREFICWELKDDMVSDPYEAGGVATYSTISAMAASYATIFDNLWKLTEFTESLKEANMKLKNSETSMKEFVDVAAHEFRTPIQPIIGLAEVLRDRTTEPESSMLLDVILRNAARLDSLQRNILDVARMENQLVRYSKDIFNIDELIVQLVKDDEKIATNSLRPEIVMELRANSLVAADKQRIAQVILNLLGNALKFTKGKIKISSTLQGSEVVVNVSDSGPGIDPEIMPRLFQKFATRSSTGTGLGLFISKSIIEANGGRIWAQNNESGNGATIGFALQVFAETSSEN